MTPGLTITYFVVLLLVLFTIVTFALLVWTTWRINRVIQYGGMIVDCRNPDCDDDPGMPDDHFILRHVGETFDFRCHGSISDVVQVWEVALKKGIVRRTT